MQVLALFLQIQVFFYADRLHEGDEESDENVIGTPSGIMYTRTVRRCAEGRQADLTLMTGMIGYPWATQSRKVRVVRPTLSAPQTFPGTDGAPPPPLDQGPGGGTAAPGTPGPGPPGVAPGGGAGISSGFDYGMPFPGRRDTLVHSPALGMFILDKKKAFPTSAYDNLRAATTDILPDLPPRVAWCFPSPTSVMRAGRSPKPAALRKASRSNNSTPALF